jgi:nucleotide-binding universal stress UspA family protein
MPFRIRSILLASDLSASEREVLRGAGALAALTGAALHVVHAVEPAGAGEADVPGEE